jgi:hypothetical protein
MRSWIVSLSVLGLLALPSAARRTSAGTTTVTFEDQDLPVDSYNNGSNLAGGFTSGGAFFNNSYDTTYGSWSGWSSSTTTDTTTPGYTNQYSAYPGSGSGGSLTYGVAYVGSPNAPYINLPTGESAVSMDLTNTSYAALSMLNGDQFAKKFGPDDFFSLTITGYSGPDLSGNTEGIPVTFFLAANGSIVSTWQAVSLASLAGAESLGFSMNSSDVGEFGINTPTYFAMDNLLMVTVPEPSSLVLMTGGLVGLTVVLRKYRRNLESRVGPVD